VKQVLRVALALASIMVLVLTGCTSDPDEAGGAAGGEDGGGAATPVEPSRGLTEDTIKIGYIGADFGDLADAGLAPDLGDQEKIVESVVAQINEDGGIGGRQVEARVKLVSGVAGPEEAEAACIEMTQDFGAFAVVFGPATSRNTASCLAVTNSTLTVGATGFDLALYEEAEGRLFTAGSDTSMSTDRQYRGWAQIMDAEGALEGKTIGVVTAEQSPEFVAAAEDALLPELEELGYEVAVDVTLPCPEGDTDCDQHESAVQQMKSAGVDFVFMAAANLTGPAFIQAAENLDFHPEWAANGNQTTDTVSQFFESVKEPWDGTIGTSTVFAAEDDLSDAAFECNATIEERSGEAYEPGSDAFGFAAVNCLTLRLLQQGAEDIEPAALDQAAMIAGIEGLGEVELNAGPPGTLSADKHDAGDHLFIADYDAGAGEFIDRAGEPVEIDG
jgi:ABC-type branched-subunit amino acid transport system substrate-binding protein